MTVSTTTAANSYLGNGAVATYAFSFLIHADSDLRVTKEDTGGNVSTLTLTTDYTVSGAGNAAGGTITLTAGNLPTGYTLVISRWIDFLQQTSLPEGSRYLGSTIERVFDRLCMMCQQLLGLSNRSIKLPASETAATDLPAASVRAGLALVFDVDGNPTVGGIPSVSSTTAGAWESTPVKATGSTEFRSLAERFADVMNVKDFGATGDGVTDDGDAIQSAVTAAGATGGVLYFPPGTYLVASPVTLANGVTYRGAGVNIDGGGTKINYTGSSDAFVISNPLNSSTSANIHIEGIWFSAPSLAAHSGVIFDTGSSVCTVKRCRFNAAIGIILDQSELWDISECSFAIGGANNVGIWIVNGPDKNVASSTFFTNRIGVHECEFNGAAGSVAVYDDGGTAHVFENCNWNACGSHIIATSVNGIIISGGEFEISSAQSIIFGTTKRKGGAGAKCPNVDIHGCFFYNNVNQPIIALVSGAVGRMNLSNNFFNTVAGTTLSGFSVGVDEVHAEGNTQNGAGDGITVLNNHYDMQVAAAAWAASSVAPSLGNGTLAATCSRKGKDVTYRLSLAIGSTTTLGTGYYTFSLPYPANTTGPVQLGSAYLLAAGASHYTATARITADGLYVELYVAAASTVGAAVPAAWANGSKIEFQVTYSTSAPM